MNGFVTDTGAVLRREWLRYRRDYPYWVGQIAFPLVAVAFIGFGLNDVVRLPTGTDYLGHLASGMLALIVGSAAVGGGMTLIQDRESGFLRVLRVAPVSAGAVVAGKILARAAASVGLVLLLVAVLAGFTPVGLPHPGPALLAVFAVTVVFVSLGIVLGAFLRSAESYRLFAALVTVPLYFLSGIFYPISTLPAPTRWLASVNPLTYGADLLRYGLLGASEVPVERSALLLCALTLACAVVAVAAYERSGDH